MAREMTQDIVFDFKWSRKQYEALTTEATEVLFGGRLVPHSIVRCY